MSNYPSLLDQITDVILYIKVCTFSDFYPLCSVSQLIQGQDKRDTTINWRQMVVILGNHWGQTPIHGIDLCLTKTS